MGPKRGIVKSGNAGNSSKPSKQAAPADDGQEEKKPLFPIGSKYPLGLLQERCQKNGWDKPSVNTRQQGNGFSFSVTLSRFNQKTSQTESVRMEPHPPYLRPSAIEARHWGATYALYRFCNGIQLNRVLPPGPRDYWNELATQHASCPEHQKWMYYADPFEARKEVDDRQAKATAKQTAATEQEPDRRRDPVSKEFAHAPEVKMAGELRTVVEDAIKKAIKLFPEDDSADGLTIAPSIAPQLQQQLVQLGFKPPQARKALEALSQPTPLTSSLLSMHAPLEACIEYSILHVPECDLPQRLLPSQNSSNRFVSSAHGRADDYAKRRLEEKASKEAGFPINAVRDVTANPEFKDWSMLIRALDHRLLGEEWADLLALAIEGPEPPEDALIDQDSIEGLGAHFAEVDPDTNAGPSELILPFIVAPAELHILLPPDKPPSLQTDNPPPMFISSQSIPAYLRLHLLAHLLQALRSDELPDPGVSFLIVALGVVDDEWASIEEKGPPDVGTVLQYLLPPPPPLEIPEDSGPSLGRKSDSRREHARRLDARTDAQVKQDYEAMCQNNGYSVLSAVRQKLPAFKSKDEFLQMLDQSRVVVVVGETGCGKTTQLPQFILDALILSHRGASASILITQPRRLSAIGVAARVSQERLEDGSVGYAIRGESKQSAKTKLLFCTTGVVLRRLATGDGLEGVTHVVVDEVHERSVDGDFLLLELKELLKKHPTIKVVLMSATINHETFIKYFNDAPLLTIPGFTHPVTDLYLEDFIPKIGYRPSGGGSRGSRKTVENEDQRRAARNDLESQGLDNDAISVIQGITRNDRLDYQLITAVVAHIMATASKRGGILVFLTGVQEIRQCIDTLKGSLNNSQADIFPLHANLSNNEQRAIFGKTAKWKVIVSTNVAETSITIDDVIYVIDAGKVKETGYNAETGIATLEEKWVTRAAARQRRGRAGRTQPGWCYKLYTRKQEGNMDKFPIPEILRVPLESVLLAIKATREDADAKAFLGQAIDPPKLDAINKAWSILADLGAVDEADTLTALGRHMSLLPLDLRLSKMLILATIFQCLEPVLTVAALLSSKPLFVNPIDNREQAKQARARFLAGGSDLLTDVRAFNEANDERAVRSFCEENFISYSSLRDISSLRQDLLSSLASTGFVANSCKPSEPSLNVHSDNENLVKAVIIGGLYPRIARVHLPKSAIKFDQVQAGTIQRENMAKEFQLFDINNNSEERVFLHPSSVLDTAKWKSPFLAYFHKHATSKVFLRDATEVPIYALLLFGGPITVSHIGGGLTIGARNTYVKLQAWPRIGVLVNHLRRLLDAQLQRCIDEGTMFQDTRDSPVLGAICALLENDGLTEQ